MCDFHFPSPRVLFRPSLGPSLSTRWLCSCLPKSGSIFLLLGLFCLAATVSIGPRFFFCSRLVVFSSFAFPPKPYSLLSKVITRFTHRVILSVLSPVDTSPLIVHTYKVFHLFSVQNNHTSHRHHCELYSCFIYPPAREGFPTRARLHRSTPNPAVLSPSIRHPLVVIISPRPSAPSPLLLLLFIIITQSRLPPHQNMVGLCMRPSIVVVVMRADQREINTGATDADPLAWR